MMEDPVRGTSVFRLEGSDPENSPVYYGLEGTNLLAVDRDTGEVTVKNNIDREDTDTLKFYATLEDIVGGQHDNNLGTYVMTVKATDGDRGIPRKIHYSLVTNPENFFAINKNTGVLTTASLLDKEKLGSSNGVVTVKIKASEMDGDTILDLPGSSTVAALAITVRDVNDEAPTFSSPSYSVNVNENIPVGSPLPNLDIFVQDTDAGSNSVFNIGLMDASGMFAVEPTIATGSTSVSIRIIKGPLDYENPNQRKFILLVVAEEAFTNPKLSSTATLTVNVQDINDNAPVFEHESYSASVVEDASPGSVVTTIAATDRDTGPQGEGGLMYSLLGNGAEKFYVNPTSGVVTVAPCETPGRGNCLDFEARSSYFLSYQATDDRGRGQSAVVPLTIMLKDANDNPPVFEQHLYSAVIDEGDVRFDPPLRVQVLFELQPDYFERRKQFCVDELERISTNRNHLPFLLFTDEAIFHLDGHVNK
ncbi:hypothetical protein HPB47_006329 [Ixodes persulcatus]|uniref:Uncharacterized protein n=1 Tax=Ixodes persulcatus TaxID=34615 RepID=A0AC60PAN9_IXOPE|nr:hypothetical protein HPB47_006329 [Ixodes persulcatus]